MFIEKNYKNQETILLDFDDVLAPCATLALKLYEERYNESIPLKDITGWGEFGSDLRNRRMEMIFQDEELYRMQKPYPDAEAFIDELKRMGLRVVIATSVRDNNASFRFAQVRDMFPQIDSVIVAHNKSDLSATFALDDSIKNCKRFTEVKYPILFRTDFNRSASGVLSVTGYKEALTFIRQHVGINTNPQQKIRIACFVGPSGSGKNDLVKALLKLGHYERIMPYTTNPNAEKANYHIVSDEEFAQYELTEKTFFAGYRYGIRCADAIGEDIQLFVTDICGALSLSAKYPREVATFYCYQSDEQMLKNLLDKDLTQQELIERIISMDAEKQNARYCDYSIHTRYPSDAAKEIHKVLTEN